MTEQKLWTYDNKFNQMYFFLKKYDPYPFVLLLRKHLKEQNLGL